MKAAVYHPAQGISIEERSVPQPGADELLIQVGAAGICGSDMHYYKDGHIGDWWVRQPHVLGHEFAGTVAATGDNVTGFSVGDRVAIEPIIPCESCDPCTRGLYNLCLNLRFTGSPHTDGAFQEYVIARPRFTHRIPDSMSFRYAALVEPTSIAVHAVRQSGLQVGDTVAIIGAGPIGLLTLAVANAAGARKTLISDLNQFRLGTAQTMGATAIVDARVDSATAINRFTDGRGVDIAFEAVGHPATIETAMQAVRPGGKLILIGVSSEAHVPINLMLAQSREITIIPIYLGRDAFPAALSLLASGRVQAEAMITHVFSLSDAAEAFDTAVNSQHEAIKVMFDMTQAPS